MNRLKITGWIAAVSSALVLSVSCGDGDDSAVQSVEQTIQAPVFRTGKSTLPTYTTAVGTLEPYNRAQLSTRVMGNVKEVMVEEGDRVRRGQALLRLDMRRPFEPYRAERGDACRGKKPAGKCRSLLQSD